MADSSASEDSPKPHTQLSASARRKTGDLDERQTPNRPVPAWQLREQMKSQNRSALGRVHRPSQRNSDSLDGDIDPALPPAFRTAAFAARQRKKGMDDFMSLDSVHSTKTQLSTMTTENSDLDDSESTFDGHGSFASLGDDDDDDEAYREGRNQMARQTIECSRSPRSMLRNNDFRFKKGGVHGTLDFIAE